MTEGTMSLSCIETCMAARMQEGHGINTCHKNWLKRLDLCNLRWMNVSVTRGQLYTDDSILAGLDQNDIEQVIKDIQMANLNITVEGDIQDFLGINISRREERSIHLLQPQLIEGILKGLRLDGKTKTTLSLSSKILKKHKDSQDFDGSFDY
jgi:hypothetical protein